MRRANVWPSKTKCHFELRARCADAFLAMALALGAGLSRSAEAASYRPGRVRVLALVAGRAVNDRQVAVDAILEDPSLFLPGAGVPAVAIERGLTRVVTQDMVLEEGKIVGGEGVDRAQVDKRLAQFRTAMGSRLGAFLKSFDLTEKDLRERIEQKLTVEKALDLRARAALGSTAVPADRGEAARQAIESWLKQLRARYRTQYFRYADDSPKS